MLCLPALAHADGLAKLASDVMLYTDTDNVLVLSPQVSAHRELDEDGGEASARVVVDAVTAASVDVISNATARFSEVRTEVDLGISKYLFGYLPSASYRYSSEPDYTSHGFGVGLQKALAHTDTVLAGQYNLALDTIGRTGTPLDTFSESLASHAAELGVTQAIDPRTLVRVVYSLTMQFGYMEKPYRAVPLFDAAGIAAARDDGVVLDLDSFDAYRLAFRPPEEVPDQRYRHALAVRGLRYVPAIDSSVRLDYRFYGDSWGIFGHTLEAALYRPLASQFRLNLWTRFHIQSPASFWQREYVVEGVNAIPAIRTMDRALAGSWHTSGGARVEWTRGSWAAYWELSTMYSRFIDHLLIDSRVAILSQGGIRWDI